MDTIAVKNITKAYGGKTVLGPVSLTVPRGELVSLVGTNGAGKSTLIEIMCGIGKPTSGTVSVFGKPPRKSKIGFLPQNLELYPKLTVKETVRHFVSLTGSGDAKELMDYFSLADRADSEYGDLSGGLKQRVNVACILCGNPEAVFMDEPNAGMDPAVRDDFWNVVRGLRDRGITVLLSTHFIDEAKRYSDRIIVLDKGRITYDGGPDAFAVTRYTVTVKNTETNRMLEQYNPTVRNGCLHIVTEGTGNLKRLLDDLERLGIPPGEIGIVSENGTGAT